MRFEQPQEGTPRHNNGRFKFGLALADCFANSLLMDSEFQGTVVKSYLLDGNRVVVFTEYEGGVEVGERVRDERSGHVFEIVQIAWGSAFNAESPPLTLVLDGPEVLNEGDTLVLQS